MKMKNIFRRKKSREIARDRLKILLISDRVNCSAEMIEMIKNDITKVISKYMKIDTQSMIFRLRQPTARDVTKCRHFMRISRFWTYIRMTEVKIDVY